MRTERLIREQNYLDRKLPSSLSYHTAVVNGTEQQLAILDSDLLDVKTVYSLPGETIQGGSLVEWEENMWLVFSEDVNREVYTKAKMQQCNYLLKWVVEENDIPIIIERWCYVSDGTKYLTGETPNLHTKNAMTLGDTRIALMIARDRYTVCFNRKSRFLIDDYDSPTALAYELTKPFKLGGVFNNRGVMTFVLTEGNTTDYDYIELRVADYYKYFNPDGTPIDKSSSGVPPVGGKKVWL